jgi:hypothetical protein
VHFGKVSNKDNILSKSLWIVLLPLFLIIGSCVSSYFHNKPEFTLDSFGFPILILILSLKLWRHFSFSLFCQTCTSRTHQLPALIIADVDHRRETWSLIGTIYILATCRVLYTGSGTFIVLQGGHCAISRGLLIEASGFLTICFVFHRWWDGIWLRKLIT